MPNRNGMVFWKGLWNVDGKPDTHNTACMRDCVAKVDVSSSLPPYARDLNGNLAEQMRIVGPVRGVDTLEPALSGKVGEHSGAIKAQARSEEGRGGKEGVGTWRYRWAAIYQKNKH